MSPQEQPKNIISGPLAKEKLLAGVEKLYIPVSSSLGPRSANTAIARPFGGPAVIHDGVKIARACLPLPDAEENVGAEIAYDAANKTNNIGDGTTTATVLCREIAKGAHKLITAGSRPMALREGIETATNFVIEELGKLAQPVDEKGDDILRIATISAQNAEIGGMVAEAYKTLGPDGILTVEESRSSETYLELKQGMEFDRGWRSPYFVPAGNKHGEATVEKPYVLVTDQHIRDHDMFVQMLVRLFSGTPDADGKPTTPQIKDIVIIADDFSPEVVAFFVANHVKGHIRGLLVNAPSYGEKRIDMLRDIAVLTGATLVSEATGTSLASVDHEMLGHAGRITSTKDTTIIVEGGGAEEDVKGRIAELEEQAKNSDLSAYDLEKLNERLARLRSGIGVLTIGARSEPEVKERIERAVDAISAAKAALNAGIVPGGGTALITAADRAESLLKEKMSDDARFGIKIVLEACRAPFRKLLTNAGFDPGEYSARLAKEPVGMGVDVMDGQIVDMVEAGIIDPVMVVSSAIGNASSAAVMIATTDNVITPKEAKSAKV